MLSKGDRVRVRDGVRDATRFPNAGVLIDIRNHPIPCVVRFDGEDRPYYFRKEELRKTTYSYIAERMV